jgi:hypothetical protein
MKIVALQGVMDQGTQGSSRASSNRPSPANRACPPLLRTGAPEYALFAPLKAYPWVLEMFEYEDVAEVRSSLDRIISPSEAKALELCGVSPPTASVTTFHPLPLPSDREDTSRSPSGKTWRRLGAGIRPGGATAASGLPWERLSAS